MNPKRKLSAVVVTLTLALASCSQKAPPTAERVGSRSDALSTGTLFAYYPYYFTSSGDYPSWNGEYGTDLKSYLTGPATFLQNLQACKDADYYHYCEQMGLQIAMTPSRDDVFQDRRWSQTDLMKSRGWQRYFAEANRIGTFFSTNSQKLSTAQKTFDKFQHDKDDWANRASEYTQFAGGSRDDAYANIGASVNRAAEATRSPVLIRLVQTKATVKELNALVARTRERLAAVSAPYSALLTRFVAYKATEASIGSSIAALAVRASSEDIEGLAKVRGELFDLAKSDSEAQSTLAVDALRLDGTYRVIKSDYELAASKYSQFLSDATLTQFAALNVANRGKDIAAYCSIRNSNRNAAIAKVYDGTRKRSDALIAGAATEAARRDLAKAKLLNASTKFLEDVTAQSTAAWKTPPQVGSQKFPLLAGTYDAMTAFTTMAPLCSSTASSPVVEWMGAGCIALNRDVNRAKIYLTASLPALLRFDGPRLQAAGTAPEIVQLMTRQLTAGDLRGAVLTHDSAALLAQEVAP